MSGTPAGAKKAVAVIKAKHGSDFFKRIGSIGGARSTTGGFASNRELARIAGAKGGRMSKRGKKLDTKPVRDATHDSGVTEAASAA